MKNFTLQTLYIKPIYPKLLSLTLLLAPALASDPTNHAFKKALGQENIQRIEELVSNHKKIDINIQGKYGNTALMLAIPKNRITLAKQLLQRHDLDVNLQNNAGYTALMLAIEQNHIPLAEQILKLHHIDVNLQNQYGYTALIFAVDSNNIDIAKQLLEHNEINVNLQERDGYTALITASRENYTTLAECLLQHDGIDVNLQNTYGYTALMFAVEFNSIDMAKHLLRHEQININLQNKEGYTALMLAIIENHTTLAQQIVQCNHIDVNLQSKFGSTALMFAIEYNNKNIAEQLVKYNDLNVNLQDIDGYTMLILAIRENYISIVQQLLTRHDLDINHSDNFGSRALSYIEDRHIDLNQPQDHNLWYVNLVKNTHLPSLYKNHALLQSSYLKTLYTQQPPNQAIKQYIDILLVNKLSHQLAEKEKTLFYNACLIAYEAKNSHYSMQARSIQRLNPSSPHQPLLDQDLINLLTGYLRSVHIKRVSYTSDWTHLIKCYLWANNPFAPQNKKPTTITLKEIHFWRNEHSPYAEFLNTANCTQERSLFNIVHQTSKYEALGTAHLAKGLKQKNIIQNEDQIFEKSITLFTPIIVAGLKALNHQLATS